VVETIAATTTETGLTVEAVLDTNTYPTAVRISDHDAKAIPITAHHFHGEWTYIVHCGPARETPANTTFTTEQTR
jgi:hypothetical protein